MPNFKVGDWVRVRGRKRKARIIAFTAPKVVRLDRAPGHIVFWNIDDLEEVEPPKRKRICERESALRRE